MQLSLLTEQGMGKAVQEFVDKEERDAIEELISYQLEKVQRYLRERHVEATEEKIDEEIRRFRDSKKNTAEEDEEVQEAINRARAHRDRADPVRDDDFHLLDEPADVAMDSDEDDAPMPPVRGRGRGSRARGGRGQSGAARGRARGAGSQASRGGRGQKAAFSSPAKNKSIMDAFQAPRGSRGSAKSYKEVAIEDSDSDDNVSFVKMSRPAQKSSSLASSSRRGSQSLSQSNKGVCFDEDDDDDEFDPFKTAGHRGRR
ncbi:hypothetical protein PDJAM_G00121890 [Pangasius djambal]|uniref:Uncharacterized protein n=1 Tax=Pangasius djambal TaxID=1691987 RepID=A0ACC5ZAC7_9TELE|nr:hypothetical protein [Pangasius djambal]